MNLAVPPSVLGLLPDGPDGSAATLNIMRAMVKAAKVDPVIRALATEITADLPSKDWMGEIAALYAWVTQHIRYVQNPTGVQVLQYPRRTLEQGSAQCADMSTLLASLLESIGHHTRFVAVAMQSPGLFDHVFIQTIYDNRRWIALDPTEPQRGMGWKPPNPQTVMYRDN